MLLRWNKDVIEDNAAEIAKEIYRPEQAGWKVWLTIDEAGKIKATVHTASTAPNPENWEPGQLLILDTWPEVRDDIPEAYTTNYITEYIGEHPEEFAGGIYRREEMDDCIYIYTPTDLWTVMDIFKNVLGEDVAPPPKKVKTNTYRVDLSVEPDEIEMILHNLSIAGYRYEHMKV